MFLNIGTGLASIQADSNSAITAAAILASGANILLSQSGNQITVAATGEISSTLTNGHILVGNASNVATDVALSGAVAITNAGVASIVYPLFGSDGSTGAPSYAFASSHQTGLFYSGTQTVTLQGQTSGAAVTINGPSTSVNVLNAVLIVPTDNGVDFGGGGGVTSIYQDSGLPGTLTFGTTGGGDSVLVSEGSATFQSTGSSTTISFKPDVVSAGQFDTSTTAHVTRFLLWDVDKGALSRVSVGAADSGGAGFKLLRVPN